MSRLYRLKVRGAKINEVTFTRRAFAGHGSRLRDVHIRVLGHEYGTRGRSRLWDREDS